MALKSSRLKCGDCARFHTRYCVMESEENIRHGLFSVSEDEEVCEGFTARKAEDLVQFFSDRLVQEFTLRYFVKGDSPIGLMMWKDGAYVRCEEYLRSYIEALANDMGLQNKIKTHIVNEAIEKTKRRVYYELGSEPLRIAFTNIVLDWEAFLPGSRGLSRERAFLPLESTRDEPCFHRIPHRLDLEFFDKVIAEGSFEKACLEHAREVVEVFRAWVGDCWKLLFEIIGYTLYPSHGLHKAFMLVGDGRNGKSTFLKLIHRILGDENVVGVSLQDLCMNRFSQALLYHKLANIYADIPSRPLEYTGYFKMLTGEDLISADRKFKERVTFRSYAKLLFSANELPEVSDMTDAFWRRWIIVEFPNKFDDNPDFFEEAFPEEVIEKIIVLSLVAFTDVWVKRRFSIEGEASDFKERWLRKSNSIYAYVKTGLEEGRLTLEREAYTPSEELYQDYAEFCEANDLEPQSKKTFTLELERLFKVTKTRIRKATERVYAYKGIRLLRHFSESLTEASTPTSEVASQIYPPDASRCEVCGSKAETTIVRRDGVHHLCGRCIERWTGSL